MGEKLGKQEKAEKEKGRRADRPERRRLEQKKGESILRPLGELRPWEHCVVERVEGEWKLRRRLAELGFLPGTPVQVVRMAPMGDPIELRIRGYRITLSREQALKIWVLPQKPVGRQETEQADSAGFPRKRRG